MRRIATTGFAVSIFLMLAGSASAGTDTGAMTAGIQTTNVLMHDPVDASSCPPSDNDDEDETDDDHDRQAQSCPPPPCPSADDDADDNGGDDNDDADDNGDRARDDDDDDRADDDDQTQRCPPPPCPSADNDADDNGGDDNDDDRGDDTDDNDRDDEAENCPPTYPPGYPPPYPTPCPEDDNGDDDVDQPGYPTYPPCPPPKDDENGKDHHDDSNGDNHDSDERGKRAKKSDRRFGPTPPRIAGAARTKSVALTARGKFMLPGVTVACPSTSRGKCTIKGSAVGGAGAAKVATVKFSLKAGRSSAVQMQLTKKGKALFARKQQVTLVTKLRVRDANGVEMTRTFKTAVEAAKLARHR